MDTILLLEDIAKSSGQDSKIKELIHSQANEVKNFFLLNDSENLKKYLSDGTDFFPNESHVVQI